MNSYAPTSNARGYMCVFLFCTYNYFTFVWIAFIASGVGGGPLPGAGSIAFIPSMNFFHTLKDSDYNEMHACMHGCIAASDYNEMHACVGAFIHNYLGTPRNTCGWTSRIVTPKVPYNRRNINYH